MRDVAVAAAVMAVSPLPRPGQARRSAATALAAGQAPAMGESTLHPFAPNLTGRAAKDLPTDKLKSRPGFKSKSGRRHSRGALARARRKSTGVREPPVEERVNAVVDRGGSREVRPFSRASRAERHRLSRGTCLSRSATRSRATTASKASSTIRAKAR